MKSGFQGTSDVSYLKWKAVWGWKHNCGSSILFDLSPKTCPVVHKFDVFCVLTLQTLSSQGQCWSLACAFNIHEKSVLERIYLFLAINFWQEKCLLQKGVNLLQWHILSPKLRTANP